MSADSVLRPGGGAPGVTVYLVGAGPGDPGLITCRGRDLLARADVIVRDYLAPEALLRLARPDAEVVFAGKKGFTAHVTQDQVNRLLVDKARELSRRATAGAPAGAGGSTAAKGPAAAGDSAGATIVRLKGGDPFVFGRGGEEALALAAAGIDFEVVPGVTSGIAAPAYAGIPVTHRKVSSSVTFVTGSEDPSRDETGVDWESLAGLARRGATLCFYMGMRNLPLICGQLMTRGADPLTPVALVRWGTAPEQRTVTSTLADADADARAAGLEAPVMTVVGPVVRLREDLAWLGRRPLQGRRVVVTRTRTQASALARRLEGLGARVVELPTIEVRPLEDYSTLDRALGRLADYDWVVFTSDNGVHAFFERLAGAGRPAGAPRFAGASRPAAPGRPADARALAGCRVAAIGPATAAALSAHGIAADAVPGRYVAEAVFDAMAACSGLGGARVLIARAQEAREALPRMLREAGALVDVAPAYRTVAPADLPDRARDLRDQLASGLVDALTFTSSSTARNLASALGPDAARLMGKGGATAFSIGPVTTQTLRDLGVGRVVEAAECTVDGVVSALVGALSPSAGMPAAGGAGHSRPPQA